MIYELSEPSKARGLFEGMRDLLLSACLEKVMGKVCAADPEHPESALAYAGSFGFCAGRPDRELILGIPEEISVLIPQNEAWSRVIEDCLPDAGRTVRYATRKDTRFDPLKLEKNLSLLPEGYELRKIGGELYDQCLERPELRAFVCAFESREQYLELGLGAAVLKDGRIVSGASSYSRCREGIEIEVITVPGERRKHLATVACSALILRCLSKGLYPSWDAKTVRSVRLAEKLGYVFDHEYPAYEIGSGERTRLSEGAPEI